MKKTKSVLIIGGSGFIGTHLCLRLREEFKVFSAYRSNNVQIPGVTPVPFNSIDRDWCKRVIYNIEPEVIIYAAGTEGMEWAEANARDADQSHTSGPANVCTVAAILQPKFIFLSNSYVFDGRKGNYRETDTVLPATTLGKAKLGGENFIKGRSLNYILVRSTPVFGRGNGRNFSMLDQIRYRLERGMRVEMVDNELHGYAPVYGLTEFVARLVATGPRNKIFHYGGLTRVSPYRFAKAFARRFGYDEKLVVTRNARYLRAGAEEGEISDYSLNTSEAANTLKIKPLLLEEGFDLFEQKLVARL